MRTTKLWLLVDRFQNFKDGYDPQGEWVRQEDAEKEVGAERSRIREELLADLEPEIRMHRIPGSQTEIECVMMRTVRAALDRICPPDTPEPG